MIEKQTENSFSRDMAMGVMAYFLSQGILGLEPMVKSRVTDEALNWLMYIEHQGKGKKMCDDDVEFGDNRCTL